MPFGLARVNCIYYYIYCIRNLATSFGLKVKNMQKYMTDLKLIWIASKENMKAMSTPLL